MWQKVKIDEVDYLIKHSKNEYRHTILITDLIYLWYEEIEENNLLVRCKDMNKLIEARNDILLGHVWSLVEGKKDNIIRIFSSSNSDSKVLDLLTSLEGFKFKIKFLLTKANSMQFYKEVTLQFLTTMTELEKRYNLLLDVIKSKDLEIMEYKLEGARISRKAVETDPFDHQAFSEKYGEGVSATKSQITGHPSDALTPLVQDLLDKVSSAPVYEYTYYKQPEEAGNSENENKRTIVKIKSPTKNKKLKMYDDDEDDETEEKGGGEASKVKEDLKEEEEVKKDYETVQKPQKGKSKTKVLLNL